ncbi:uncharacterized protein MONBRDRAFT_30460 [Monosiga brevicollis MX1]|uniref:CARMIL pleckstrin homology domain-containing protein n=1 Tax=Monosiga brevicollis TaxID=81824 RepID=A9VE05_MONBE|nr:uncharacterized protein MONBRDRAFT_30460 [Monosiga brevicollis MX1]EDQ84225.1 predicted protein [Monosiga brevicollis MX1]|eukprot:XP_001750949.1 hypothetical protein [Monosiga brevicollis MX1]
MAAAQAVSAVLPQQSLAFTADVTLVINADRNKTDDKALGVAGDRLVLVSPRPPFKIDTEINVLDLTRLDILSDDQSLVIESTTSSPLRLRGLEQDAPALAAILYDALRNIYLVGDVRCVFSCPLQVQPPADQDVSQRQDVDCAAFLPAYQHACKYHGLTPQQLTVQKIVGRYQASRTRTLDGLDFMAMSLTSSPAIVTALHVNPWFTTLKLNDLKMSPATLDSLAMLALRNNTLQTIEMRNLSSADSKFWGKFLGNLKNNPRLSIQDFDFSQNNLGDPLVTAFADSARTFVLGVRRLRMVNVSMSTKGAMVLAIALRKNPSSASGLQLIDISENPTIGHEGVIGLIDMLLQANILQSVNVNNTGAVVESILMTMAKAICTHLTHLDLGNNKFASKKAGRPQPQLVKFLEHAPVIQSLCLNGVKLPSVALKFLLDSLSVNVLLTNLELGLANCDLGVSESASVIHMALPKLTTIGKLDFSQNEFSDDDMAKIIGAAAANSATLNSLVLDENLSRARTSQRSMLALRSLFEGSYKGLRHLSLKDMKLKQDLVNLFPSLSENTSIEHLDIRGNHVGDAGASALAVTLNYNKALRRIDLDDNGISHIGFMELANALENNVVMQDLPMPLLDITASMSRNQAETVAAVHRIQLALARNHSPARQMIGQVTVDPEEAGAQDERWLHSLVEALQSTASFAPEDRIAGDEALLRAQKAVQATRAGVERQASLLKAQEALVAEQASSLARGLESVLVQALEKNTGEIVALLAAESGTDPAVLRQAAHYQHADICRRLVTEVIEEGVRPTLTAALGQQLETFTQKAILEILGAAGQEVSRVLDARKTGTALAARAAHTKASPAKEAPPPSAAKPTEAKASPTPARRARAADAALKAKQRVSTLQDSQTSETPEVSRSAVLVSTSADPDDVEEGGIDIDAGPAAAGAANAGPSLTHHTKGRPKVQGKRPPTRKPRSNASSRHASTTPSLSASIFAATSPTPAPRAAPRVQKEDEVEASSPAEPKESNGGSDAGETSSPSKDVKDVKGGKRLLGGLFRRRSKDLLAGSEEVAVDDAEEDQSEPPKESAVDTPEADASAPAERAEDKMTKEDGEREAIVPKPRPRPPPPSGAPPPQATPEAAPKAERTKPVGGVAMGFVPTKDMLSRVRSASVKRRSATSSEEADANQGAAQQEPTSEPVKVLNVAGLPQGESTVDEVAPVPVAKPRPEAPASEVAKPKTEPVDAEAPTADSSAAAKPPVVEPPAAKPPVVEPPAAKPPVVEPPAAKPPVVEPPAAKPPVVEPPAAKPPLVEPPAAKPPVVEPPAAKPPVVEPPAAKPPVVEPPAAKPPLVEPPAAKPPVVEPPAAKPPVVEPPAAKPPVVEPTATQGAELEAIPAPAKNMDDTLSEETSDNGVTAEDAALAEDEEPAAADVEDEENEDDENGEDGEDDDAWGEEELALDAPVPEPAPRGAQAAVAAMEGDAQADESAAAPPPPRRSSSLSQASVPRAKPRPSGPGVAPKAKPKPQPPAPKAKVAPPAPTPKPKPKPTP